MAYTIAYYFTAFMSNGLDGYLHSDTLDNAIKKARIVCKKFGGRAQCTIINEYGKLEASIFISNGRILTKKAK